MKPFNQIPQKVTDARDAAGLKMAQVAAHQGKSLSLISEIESGTRNAQIPLLRGMADQFGCALDELLSDEGRALLAAESTEVEAASS